MKKIICVILAVLALSGTALAHSMNYPDREEQFIREEASKRGMKLISPEEAVRIAKERIGGQNVRIKDVDLEDEDDYYYMAGTNFYPVWSIEAVSGRDEYDIHVDAVTGKILKFKIDD